MKRYILYIIACISLCSCSEVGDIDDVIILKELLNDNAEVLTVSPETMTFEADGGQQQLAVRSNASWAVGSSETWCKPQVTTGYGNETVAIEVDKNTSTDKRSASVVVSTETKTITIRITQKGTEESSDIPGSGDNRPPSLQPKEDV